MSWSLPVVGGYVTDDFGPRDTGIPGASTFHRGVDIGGRGTDWLVRSVGDGQVLATGWNAYRGRWIAIRHGDGTTATYQHLARVDAVKGRSVSAGSVLGLMGNTATAITVAVHLHLEWFPAGAFLLSADGFASTDRAVDPEPALRVRGVDLRTGTVTATTTTSVPTAPTITVPDPIDALVEALMAGPRFVQATGDPTQYYVDLDRAAMVGVPSQDAKTVIVEISGIKADPIQTTARGRDDLRRFLAALAQA